MDDHKLLIYALVTSLLLHVTFLVRFTSLSTRYLKKPLKSLEVTYYKIKPEHPQEAKLSEERKITKEERLGKNSKILLNDDKQISPIIKEMAKIPIASKLQNKQPAGLEKMIIGRKISVPPVKSEKINNPVYLNYYQLVRERIKERAYMNYSKFDAGEVYLTFVLFSDGSIKQIKLIEDKTTGNEYLRIVGLRSINEASPFPAFPRDLNYPELSFNVVISFEFSEAVK